MPAPSRLLLMGGAQPGCHARFMAELSPLPLPTAFLTVAWAAPQLPPSPVHPLPAHLPKDLSQLLLCLLHPRAPWRSQTSPRSALGSPMALCCGSQSLNALNLLHWLFLHSQLCMVFPLTERSIPQFSSEIYHVPKIAAFWYLPLMAPLAFLATSCSGIACTIFIFYKCLPTVL